MRLNVFTELPQRTGNPGHGHPGHKNGKNIIPLVNSQCLCVLAARRKGVLHFNRVEPMTTAEAEQLALYLSIVQTHVPNEDDFRDLDDVFDFAISDLWMFARFGKEAKFLEQAEDFAKSIPQFIDFESDQFTDWLRTDDAYITYICRTNL